MSGRCPPELCPWCGAIERRRLPTNFGEPAPVDVRRPVGVVVQGGPLSRSIPEIGKKVNAELAQCPVNELTEVFSKIPSESGGRGIMGHDGDLRSSTRERQALFSSGREGGPCGARGPSGARRAVIDEPRNADATGSAGV